MKQEDIIVWFWDTYQGGSYIKNRVLKIPKATEKLHERGLELTIDVEKATWNLKPLKPRISLRFPSNNIGEETSFTYRGEMGELDNCVGVYDKTNIKHLQSMISSVRHAKSQRSEAYDVDSL